jgi:autotransporter-associated beta strand protein
VTSTLTLNGGTLNLVGNSIGGANAVTFNAESGTLENVAQINNGGAVNKIAGSGSNTLTVAGVNTWTGATSVTAGTMIVSGSISGTSSVSVGNGTAAAILAGTGTIATANTGTVTVNNAATLMPGASAAGLTINAQPSGTSALDLNAGSALQLSIANSNAGSGAPALADYSKLTLGTGVSATIASSNIAVITGSGVQGDVFTVILNNGGSAVAGTFANATPASGNFAIFSSNGQAYEIDYAYGGPTTASGMSQTAFENEPIGNNVALLMIPEPNSWAMLLGSLGVALGLQRFRRRKS